MRMDEKDREERILERLEELKWPKPTRKQTGKENIHTFLHLVDECLGYKEPAQYHVGAKKNLK